MRIRKPRLLNMKLEDYTKAILPIVDLCMEEKASNPKSYKSSHLWYLYRQIFYGYTEFIDWDSRCKVSKEAIPVYAAIVPDGNLRLRKWHEQNEFDKGRKIFLFEHIYTGDMFRTAIENLSKDNRTVEMIVDLVRKEYCVAWILRIENKLLPRSKRGNSLHDAIETFKQAGVTLI